MFLARGSKGSWIPMDFLGFPGFGPGFGPVEDPVWGPCLRTLFGALFGVLVWGVPFWGATKGCSMDLQWDSIGIRGAPLCSTPNTPVWGACLGGTQTQPQPASLGPRAGPLPGESLTAAVRPSASVCAGVTLRGQVCIPARSQNPRPPFLSLQNHTPT